MKAMVLISGGIDSTTCLGMAVDKYGSDQVVGLSVYYGQRHEKEILSANAVARHYGIEHKKLDMRKIFEDSDCSLLLGSQKEIPEKSYAEQLTSSNGNPVSTYVPYRNGLFLSAAASMAIANRCEEIYYGAHADDAAGNAYPDCSKEFNAAISEAIYLGSGCKVRVVAPFIEKTKAEVVKIGLDLNVPYHLTWSCYAGGEKPCGVCGTCRDRQKAFEANGVDDPALKEEKE